MCGGLYLHLERSTAGDPQNIAVLTIGDLQRFNANCSGTLRHLPKITSEGNDNV